MAMSILQTGLMFSCIATASVSKSEINIVCDQGAELNGLSATITYRDRTPKQRPFVKYTLRYTAAKNPWELQTTEKIIVRYFDKDLHLLENEERKHILLSETFVNKHLQQFSVLIFLSPPMEATFFEIELSSGPLVTPKERIP